MIRWLLRVPLLCCLFSALLSGCAPVAQRVNGLDAQPQLQPQPAVNRPGPAESYFSRKGKADDLLIYSQLVQGMTAPQQEKEFDQAKIDFSKGGRAEDRLRLALLYLLPERSSTDRGPALKMLEEHLADNGREKTSLDGLALLLKQLLSEQRSSQRQLNAEKERSEGLARQLNEQKGQVDELKTQVDELKKQLEDLKKIEKIISERERKGLPEKRQ